MKKLLAILMSLVFVFCFSTLAFATGEEVEKADEETVSGDEFVYTDGAYEFSDEEEQMLENIYGEDFVDSLENGEFDLNQMLESTGLEKSTLLLAMIFTTTSLLFIPTLIVLIVFISKNSKVKKQIRNYEITYGAGFNSGANFPPQNYNYNPQNFAPQYPVNNMPQQNQDISAFTDALKNEANKENNDGGNL